ncbi:inner membrane protein [Leminorella grimontii]|uniref:Inner membrane protein n=1 Tax=Leminorella grimontii TaxID=82981 RepID=A0AAV5N4D7_9GAMM|nr:DUF454 family protein [Leminorella grimontii]KFC97195.1 hypothetical protein GLGR_0733 [Leminorella grimontii ATCC 33999 = DSM 5078]GKX56961.1 inner membrane protein [Leminorella grimontii]VFS57420.1 Inner membrane protein ybaN [Leminorella grimontii]
MYKLFLLCLGWLSIGLAALGVLLPILPTTPFLLLAAWCFARSSPRFHDWLLYRSWFGPYLRHWQTYRGLPPGAKSKAILLIICTFAVSLWLVSMLWVRVLLMAILVVLLTFMLRLPVVDVKKQQPAASENDGGIPPE